MDNLKYSRKATLSLKITDFEVPPMQDLLIIGKRSPIGPEAVRRMAEAMSPDQFSVLRVKHPTIEAVLVKKSILQVLEEEQLINIVIEECEKIVNETSVLRSEFKISIVVEREVELK